MLTPKVIVAIDALVAGPCAVAAIVAANTPRTSRAPATRSHFSAPLDRAVDVALGQSITLSARRVSVRKTVAASRAPAASAPSIPIAAPAQSGRSHVTDQQSEDCVPPATSGCPNPGTTYASQQRRSVQRRSPSTTMAGATATTPLAVAPATCADGGPAPCTHVSFRRTCPFRTCRPSPHVPLPHVPSPHCKVETVPGQYVRVPC